MFNEKKSASLIPKNAIRQDAGCTIKKLNYEQKSFRNVVLRYLFILTV